MLNTKRLIEIAKKPQKLVSSGRRNMSMRNYGDRASDECSTTTACRGHLFVYTTDGERFMVPLGYLTSNIFRELFRMSEEEFGLQSNGPITFPFDAAFMEYIISLIQCKVSRNVERAVLTSIAGSQCTASLPRQGHNHQQLILEGF